MDRGERGEQEYDVHLFEFWIFGSGFRTNREKKVKKLPLGHGEIRPPGSLAI